MLESIHLKDVGPASEMKMDLAPRANLITGDNGLGKSFLLDVAWWALTRTWARGLVLPRAGSTGAEISYAYPKRSPGRCRQTSSFNRETEEWSVRTGRSLTPGLVLYAQVDGGSGW